MINGFLLGYTVCTAPLIIWALFSALKKRKNTVDNEEEFAGLESMLSQVAKTHGMQIEVQTVPKTAAEAIMVQSQLIIKSVKGSTEVLVPWLSSISGKADTNKRDMDAIMHALQAITKAILDMNDKGKKPDLQNGIETFVHSLEYARDMFAKTEAQKKVVQGIIINVKTLHGTKK